MKLIFKDRQFSFKLIRTLGYAVYGCANMGECINTAYRIKNGDFESWYIEWMKTADRVFQIGEDCLKSGKKISGREALLRASNYYRTAEFFLHEHKGDDRALSAYRMSRKVFIEACPLFETGIEQVDIPYEDTFLKGYFFRADPGENARPTLIINGGFDSTAEENFGTAMAAKRCGYNALAFDGPGQGYALREQKLFFRPDWENVIAPVIDWLEGRHDVNTGKIALIGYSFGGYLAPRAAAFEPRLAACIANGGVYNLFDATVKGGNSKMIRKELERDDSPMINWIMKNIIMRFSTTVRWAIQDSLWKHNVSTPSQVMKKYKDYSLEGLAGQIHCPRLVCDSEKEMFFAGQSRILFDHLTCPKEWCY
jgi:pimeloyl-ACP methyl ester carboxylesterase